MQDNIFYFQQTCLFVLDLFFICIKIQAFLINDLRMVVYYSGKRLIREKVY